MEEGFQWPSNDLRLAGHSLQKFLYKIDRTTFNFAVPITLFLNKVCTLSNYFDN